MKHLDESAKACLLDLAVEAIASRLGQDAPAPAENPILRIHAGAFVTLRSDDALRGCIGRMDETDPLSIVVPEMARAAAFRDHRFTPVRTEELGSIDLEISVLTPTERVQGPTAIQAGIHGVRFALHGRSAVFLPQVATEQGWDVPTMLSRLAYKAGLPAESWRDPDAEFRVFRALVFERPSAFAFLAET